MRSLIIALLLLMVACAPMPEVAQETPQYLNGNPELTFGECVDVVFVTEQWGEEHIQQCTPDGYTLYEHTTIPVAVSNTGTGYSMRPRGASGAIGYTLPETRLDEGCYLVKVSGFAHVWGSIGDYWIEANFSTPDMLSVTRMGKHSLIANGGYLAVFVLDAPARNDYSINVFLWLQFGSATDDSFLTMEAITVETVDIGYCGRG
jgi:hypothetical protein